MLLLKATGLDHDVTLQAHAEGYIVQYGTHSSIEDTFEEALAEFTSCVTHSATCAGLLD